MGVQPVATGLKLKTAKAPVALDRANPHLFFIKADADFVALNNDGTAITGAATSLCTQVCHAQCIGNVS